MGRVSRSLPQWVLRSGGLLTSLGSDYVLVLFQRTCLVLWSWSSPVVVLSHTFLCCVSYVPLSLPLPAYYPIVHVLGVVLVRSYLVIVCACVCVMCLLTWYLVSHDGLYLYGLIVFVIQP